MVIYETNRSFFNYEIYKQYDENLNFAMHFHNSFELLYVCSGKISVTVDTKDYDVREGEAILILPNRLHSYRTDEHSRTSLYIFSNNLIKSFYQETIDKNPINPVFVLSETQLIEELDKDSEDIYLLKSVFYRIAYLFSRNTGFTERSSKSLENYGKILDFISKNYTENITAIDVAKELGYDHRYVTALIKKGLQTTFRALLNEYRISNAQYLLTTESKSISQIAHECGYESLCSFNRNFKEITGTTPMIFRNNAKKVKKHM
ncbi:MAG: helix-turn-helix transcriptional regulator [Clostridia bacterium]|nr:helix-turn-helix transcriptional regulator [Clostridia bacterium]